MKKGYRRRASWLNILTHPGKFKSLEEYNIQNENIIESLTLDWRQFIGLLRSAVVRKPSTLLSQLEICFGKERVKF